LHQRAASCWLHRRGREMSVGGEEMPMGVTREAVRAGRRSVARRGEEMQMLAGAEETPRRSGLQAAHRHARDADAPLPLPRV
jgi:hypothetical protein